MQFTPYEEIKDSLEDAFEKPEYVFQGWYQAQEKDRVVLSPQREYVPEKAYISAEIKKTKQEVSVALSCDADFIQESSEIRFYVGDDGKIWITESRGLLPTHTVHLIAGYDGNTGKITDMKMEERNSKGYTADFSLERYLNIGQQPQYPCLKSKISRYTYKMAFTYASSSVKNQINSWEIDIDICSSPSLYLFWKESKVLGFTSIDLPQEISASEMVRILQQRKMDIFETKLRHDYIRNFVKLLIQLRKLRKIT